MRTLIFLLLATSCAGLSRAERVQLGVDAMRAGCEAYRADTSIPREPEVDEVCEILRPK